MCKFAAKEKAKKITKDTDTVMEQWGHHAAFSLRENLLSSPYTPNKIFKINFAKISIHSQYWLGFALEHCYNFETGTCLPEFVCFCNFFCNNSYFLWLLLIDIH